MARKSELAKAAAAAELSDAKNEGRAPKSLAALLTNKSKFSQFKMWLVGNTPLISHAWSEKARREMLQKQVKATKPGKAARDPQEDFVNSLYDMGNGAYGFPATAFKKCVLSAAHKDKGIARSAVMGGLWLNAEMVRVRPALAGAVCDVPLLRIYSGKPEMREDMVKIGSGLQKIANLAYRAQFTNWAVKVSGQFNPGVLTPEALAMLVEESGLSCGVGEWRNEKSGMFGSFHLATEEEEVAWESYAAGKGPLPTVQNYAMAAE